MYSSILSKRFVELSALAFISTSTPGCTEQEQEVVAAESEDRETEDPETEDPETEDPETEDPETEDPESDVPDNATGCEAFCAAKVRVNLEVCLNDGEDLPEAECLELCEIFEFESAAQCVAEAGDDCDELEICIADANSTPVVFDVAGTDAMMNGVIDANTVATVEDLIADHPEVERIVMQEVPGSINDDANLVASRLIREAGLATYVSAGGLIASGGVDFFIAGATRDADVAGGALIGVHSWAGLDISGADIPKDDSAHNLYLDYYEEMGIPADFYWFTLDAAPPEDVHWMTEDEVRLYSLTTTN